MKPVVWNVVIALIASAASSAITATVIYSQAAYNQERTINAIRNAETQIRGDMHRYQIQNAAEAKQSPATPDRQASKTRFGNRRTAYTPRLSVPAGS